MIVGIGVDLCDVPRIERELAHGGPALAAAIFTPREIADCERLPRAARRLAACFAAKEAVLKALAVDGREGLLLRCVEVWEDGPNGRPAVVVHGPAAQLAARRSVGHIHLALRVTRTLAAACAILEAAEREPTFPNEVS